jgi:tRNA(fMet)-specific endonuclease VapC
LSAPTDDRHPIYLLDTNTVSLFLRAVDPGLRQKIEAASPGALAISCVTEAELLYGLKNNSRDENLHRLVSAFLLLIKCEPWDSAAARKYAQLRYDCRVAGKPLGNLDLLIAAQALSLGVVLVSNDHSFRNIRNGPPVEDWCTA